MGVAWHPRDTDSQSELRSHVLTLRPVPALAGVSDDVACLDNLSNPPSALPPHTL